MRKYRFVYIAGIWLFFLSGCSSVTHAEIGTEDFIQTVEETAEPVANAYFPLSERFYDLYEKLEFDIYLPTGMLLYDTGASDGIVRLCDKSGKNIITLENRNKDDYEKLYQEYLHGVSTSLSDYQSFYAYDDVTLEYQETVYHAKRFDVKINDVTHMTTEPESGRDIPEQRLISYWFIDKNIKPDEKEPEKKRAAYIITIETTSENVENMMKILTTFHQADMKSGE